MKFFLTWGEWGRYTAFLEVGWDIQEKLALGCGRRGRVFLRGGEGGCGTLGWRRTIFSGGDY